MPQSTDNADLLTEGGAHQVTRDQIVRAMEEYDRRVRERVKWDNNQGFSIIKDGKRYIPKWIVKLATGLNLPKIRLIEARKTLSALGFELTFDPEWRNKRRNPAPRGDDDGDGQQVEEEAVELTFDIERDLQRVLRDNIEQLEPKLTIIDGGIEKTVPTGKIDITAVDGGGATVVIELKTGEADRSAIGQIWTDFGLHGRSNRRQEAQF